MWILESRGDFFQGRRMWLKPGKQYLFGRVKKDGVRFALDHKTVSRKHFIISIDEVKDADVGNTRARTSVTISDQGSKTGTLLNGEKAREPRSLTEIENVIRLGTCQEELIVRWEPVVLTFNLLKKEQKTGLLKAKQGRIRELDIKVISDYIQGTTSYLVANKRNTAKGLQALVDGKYVVDESYVDALEYAATPSDLEEEENLSPLELDFDKAWPNPSDHLPPKGKEPTVRKDDSYKPDTSRGNIFQNYTFVFADQTQYDNLLPPITLGHGKALLFPLVDGETTAAEMMMYMRNAAGSKSFGDHDKDADAGAVILVRWTSKTSAEWTMQLINEVALSLDQRAIEQSEFLDAILASDASSLRRSVPYENTQDDKVPHSSTGQSTASNGVPTRDRPGSQTSAQAALVSSHTLEAFADSSSHLSAAPVSNGNIKDDEDESPPPATFRFSPRLKPKSSAFDDDFDEDAIIPFDEEDEVQNASSAASSPQAENGHGRSGHLSPGTQVDEDFVTASGVPQKRQRSTTVGDQVTSDNKDLDDFLPAATSMKRRKTAHEEQSESGNTLKNPLRAGLTLLKSKRKNLKDLDVKEELRVRKEQDRKRKETQNAYDDEEDRKRLEFDEEGNLMVYEVQTDLTDLPVRKRANAADDASESSGWDPKWNGRKNFKAFRRARDIPAGASAQRRKAHTKVIVPLIDAKQNTYGIGDQYWERTEEDRERDKARKQKASQRSVQSQHNSSEQRPSQQREYSERLDEFDEEAEDVSEADETASQVSPRLARLQQEAAEILDDDVDITEPRRTRADDARSQLTSNNNTQAQTQTSSRTTQGTKRPSSSGKGAAAKKQKTLPLNTVRGNDEDSDDSDDLKFKFGKGRRTRGRAKT